MSILVSNSAFPFLFHRKSTMSCYVELLGLSACLILAFKAFSWTKKVIRIYIIDQLKSECDYKLRYGKWAVLTGATDGIGLEFARQLASRGHSVLLIGRNESKLAKCAHQISSEVRNVDVKTICVDLSDVSVKNYARLDSHLRELELDIGILVNCVGFGANKMQRLHHFELRDLTAMMSLNVNAAVLMSRLVLPQMAQKARGLILNVSSTLDVGRFAALYGTSKAFMNELGREIRAEYSTCGVDCITLRPGPVDTRMAREFWLSSNSMALFQSNCESLARTTLNALASRPDELAGCWLHELALVQFELFKLLDMTDLYIKLMSTQVRDVNIRPPAQERNLSD